MGNYKEFIEETDIGNITSMVTDKETSTNKPYHTSHSVLLQLMNGYIDAIKEIQRHIVGTRRRCKWIRITLFIGPQKLQHFPMNLFI